jgi:hypothetical protein
MSREPASAFARMLRHLRRSCNAPFPALLVALVALGVPARSRAQVQPILITEPVQWRAGSAAQVTQGKALRVAGSVTHAAGVAKVLVNGREASLRQDPEYPDYFLFETQLPFDAITREVVVTLVAKDDRRIEQRFAVTGLGGPEPAAGNGAALGHQEPPPVHSWRPFALRSLLYGAGMAAGAVLSAKSTSSTTELCTQGTGGSDCVNRTETRRPNQAIGVGLVSAGAAMFVIDALMTKRRAGSARAPEPTVALGPSRLSLAMPTATMTGSGVRVDLFRFELH